MKISRMLADAYALSLSRQPHLNASWVGAGVRVGAKLPTSSLIMSVQQIGRIDILLRCLEEDCLADQSMSSYSPFSFDLQSLLSNQWISASYEVCRLLISRKLDDSPAFKSIARDLKLIRIPIDKHEIAEEQRIGGSLRFKRYPAQADDTEEHTYSPSDPTRSHIMPSGVSARGSIQWLVTDTKSMQSYWLERVSLADRLLEHWAIERTVPQSDDKVLP
ncbi:MAG: hypothetical protein JNL25_02710 [Rhodospirillaceae bacterium]|nr:hypothetical protein [Rhodospirillaceae bacterium]